ncbi:extracellular solute-binding protein, partial [Oenococcus oeni]
VPYATNAAGVIYNKALFKKAGIKTVPTTWNELIADAKILKAKGITPFESAYKDTWTTMAT